MNLTKIIKNLGFILTIAAMAPNIVSCRDEAWFADDEVERIDNRPMVLEVNLPDAFTRSVNPKKQFENGEFIHVQGTFHMDDDTDEIRYGAFQYLEGEWVQYVPEGTIDYQPMTWPNNCLTAEFTAYYVAGTNSVLAPTDNTQNNPVTNLSDVAGKNGEYDTDPLVARSNGEIKYGHTIVLNFIHACAYLTVEDMPTGISNRFWFTQADDNDEVSPTFFNAFRISRNMSNMLIFEFVQDPNPAYNNAVYIEGATITTVTDGVEKASFGVFLPPGQYTNFTVGYPGADTFEPYMRYKKQSQPQEPDGDSGTEPGDTDSDGQPDITDEEGDANPNNFLMENGVYRFNLSKSAGVSILSPTPPEVWDDNENPIYPVDAEEFLYKVCNPADYEIPWEGGMVKILEVVGNGTRLLQNVNMQWEKYEVYPPSEVNFYTYFEPDLSRGITFDGNHHWIWNLGSPLFHTINGTVKNLGITNADMSFVTRWKYIPPGYEPKNELDYFEFNRRGALCNYVQEGTIENIRIRAKLPDWYENNVEPTDLKNYYNAVFNINAYVEAETSQEAHSIGCLVGSNLSGIISTIAITCDMNLQVANYPDTPAIPTLSIGGIVGQSLSTVTGIDTENSPSIFINNVCSYTNASYYVGGIVGYHSGGTISNVILPNVTLENRQSSGFTSYIGGAAGGLSNADGGELLNCIVSGNVYAGTCRANTVGQNGASFTGGLAGECYESYTVNGCRAKINVYGATGNLVATSGVTYGTGGVFGRILRLAPTQTPDRIGNIIANGTTLAGPPEFIGNFSGIVPTGETWIDNYQDRDIIVSIHQNVPEYIGSNQ